MPKPVNGPSHLDEAFALAQLVAADRREAVHITERAIDEAGPGRASRFPLLRAVIQSAGLFRSSPDDGSAEGGSPGHPPAAALPTTTPEAPADEVPEEPFVASSLADVLAGREVLRRVAPRAVAALDPDDRALVWLDACGLSNAADLGAVLGLSAPESLQWLVGARSRLANAILEAAAGAERPLAAAALRTSEPGELVRRSLDPLLDAAPAALRERAAPPAPAAPVPASRPSRARLSAFVRVATFIVVAAAVGWSIRSFRPSTSSHPDVVASDLVGLAVDAAGETRPAFRATGAEQAEVFILDRVGWRVVVPTLEGRRLEGVGVHVFDSSTETPALIYDGTDRVVLFVFTYAYLDRAAPMLGIGRDVLDQVAEAGRFAVVDTGRKRALVFRNRDDIYVAVTTGDPVALRDAVTFPE